MEEGQLVIACIPKPVILAIVTPRGFIGMGHRQGVDFLTQVFIEGSPSTGGLPLKAIGAGRDEGQAEEIAEEAADFTAGHIQLVAQIDGRGFGSRPDVGPK